MSQSTRFPTALFALESVLTYCLILYRYLYCTCHTWLTNLSASHVGDVISIVMKLLKERQPPNEAVNARPEIFIIYPLRTRIHWSQWIANDKLQEWSSVYLPKGKAYRRRRRNSVVSSDVGEENKFVQGRRLVEVEFVRRGPVRCKLFVSL